MFNGIVTHLGQFRKRENNTLSFEAPQSLVKQLKQGSSIAVNGACLTIVAKTEHDFTIEIMPETLRRTVFNDVTIGTSVNLELPMKADDRFEGHIVQGHVDGTGTIISILPEGNSYLFRVKTSAELCRVIVTKGSIAINGISLTLIEVGDDWFTVGIIPYTMSRTMIRYAKLGDKVNIEIDILVKYIQQLLQKKKKETI